MRLIRLGIAPVALAVTAAAGIAQDSATTPPPAPPAPPVVEHPAPPQPQPQPQPAPELPPSAPAPVAEAVPPAPPPPPAPYRRCSQAGRSYASLGTCALRVVPGQVARLQVRIERSLPARPGAIILVWREREGVGGVMYRITGRALGANPGQTAGTILSVPVSSRYCAPTARPFDVELELEGGRNLGLIGRFTFPCAG